MLWEEAKAIIDQLRQRDSVIIEFCYAPHGDAVFVTTGTKPKPGGRHIKGSGTGPNAFEDALLNARQYTGGG